MPWIALHDGEKKAPEQVPIQTDVECPTCGEQMRVRRRSEDGRARHFLHKKNLGGNDGGGGKGSACESVAESREHKKWKSLAVSCLKREFGDRISNSRMEMKLDAPESEKDHRRADAIALFEDRDEQLGQGIVIEVQHKNESKDVEAVTRDLLSLDLAVVWADSSDFADDRCRLTEADLRKRARDHVWPAYADLWDNEWPEYYVPKLFDSDDGPREVSRVGWQQLRVITLYEVEFDDPEVPATLPKEWYDDKALDIWRRQDWGDIFSPSTVQEYISDVAKTGTTGPVPSHLFSPDTPFPRDIWRRYSDYFLSAGTHREMISREMQDAYSSPQMEVDIAPFISEEKWRLWFELGVDEEYDRSDIDRPPTVFDDVQCQNCGRYIYWKEAGERCDNCGAPYDWLWNIKTGRISADSVPDGIDVR